MFSLGGYAPPPYDPPRISVWCVSGPPCPAGPHPAAAGPHRIFPGLRPPRFAPPLIRLSRWDGMRRRELVWDGMRRRRSWNGRSWNGRCRFV